MCPVLAGPLTFGTIDTGRPTRSIATVAARHADKADRQTAHSIGKGLALSSPGCDPDGVPSPQEKSPCIGAVRARATALWWRLNDAAATLYVGAASLIGFEALALVLGFTTAWPIFIPAAVGLLGVIYVCRRWLKVALRGLHRQRR